MTDSFKEKIQAYAHLSVVVAFLVAVCIAARSLVIPLAFSFLFAVILNPFLRRLQSWGLNRVLSIVTVLFSFSLLLGGFLLFSAYQLNDLLEDLPSIQKKISALFAGLAKRIQALTGQPLLGENGLLQDSLKNAAPLFSSFLSTTSSVATIAVQIPIYVFLILLYKEKFVSFLGALWHDDAQAHRRSAEVKQVVQNYVSGLFMVILILAVLNSLGLFLLGIRYALFFGVLSAMLTVIPYLGNFIGGAFPFLVALVTKDSLWYPVGVVAVYAFIQFLEGNFITPNIMGSRVSVNPLAALVALLLGGQILGIAGIILAIPFVGILKTTFAHSQTLQPLVLLIEDRASPREP